MYFYPHEKVKYDYCHLICIKIIAVKSTSVVYFNLFLITLKKYQLKGWGIKFAYSLLRTSYLSTRGVIQVLWNLTEISHETRTLDRTEKAICWSILPTRQTSSASPHTHFLVKGPLPLVWIIGIPKRTV